MEIYEDENLIAIEKPSGLATLNEGNIKESLEDLLIKRHPYLKKIERSGIVHRLDKGTSGIILCAKSNQSLLFFQKQFKTREIEKEYKCLCRGILPSEKGLIDYPIGRSKKDYRKQKVYSSFEEKESARDALTEYIREEIFDNYTLLRVMPKTGRKHQIRCHLAHIGYPLAGDNLYSFKNQKDPDGLERIFLHSSSIKPKLPSGKKIEIKSDLPEDLKKVLEKLRKKYG